MSNTTPTPAPAPMTAAPDTRPPVEHELKTWASYFHALVAGTKTFEIRRDDRGFRIGDTLRLRETNYGDGTYTGREMARRITHILRHESDLGLMDGFCILSLADDALTARVAELERNAHLVPNPHCGISTNGVNVQGDEASIKAVRDWLHSHTAVVPVLRDRAQAAEAALKEARIERNSAQTEAKLYDASVQEWKDPAQAAEAKLEIAHRTLRMWQSYGCPVCLGDCAAANPPVIECAMQETERALQTKDTTP